MTMTRKTFLGAASGGTLLLLLDACGGGGDGGYGGSAAPALSQCGASAAAISGNHGHTLSIPVADLDSALAMSYSIVGSAGHDHLVTFSAAQLKLLKSGQSVVVTSTTTAQHQHDVTPSCR